MNDICPMMSSADGEVLCTSRCAWYDTELNECAVSRINGNTKWLETISKELMKQAEPSLHL